MRIAVNRDTEDTRDRTKYVGVRPSAGERPHQESLVIIPTYNEVGTLEPLVLSVLAKGPFDVLVVDDHSPDGTGDLADDLAQRLPDRVIVLHRPGKLGLGTAYILGFAYALGAGYEHVFQMDADFSHDPDRLPALRGALDHADAVLGSRYAPGGSTRRWPLWRRALSRGGSFYAALVLGLPLRDVTSGFKGFRRKVLETLDFATLRANGYSFQIEVTYHCYRQGFRIVEVPITFEDRRIGRSKMSGRIVAEALVMVWRLRFASAQKRMLPWSGSPHVVR